jgi:subtilisin family serine protease
MLMSSLRLSWLLLVAACVPVSSTPAPSPSPAPAAAAPTAPALTEAPRNWQFLDLAADRVPGISLRRAERELLADMRPRRTVVVAVIDGGVDTAHVGLKANLWMNPGEIANGRDDDANGYVDDRYGWNFIGGRDGRSVKEDGLEVTRLYARCTASSNGAAAPDSTTCARVRTEYEQASTESRQQLAQVRQIETVSNRVNATLRRAMGTDSLTRAKVEAFAPTAEDAVQAKTLWLRLDDAGITPTVLAEAKQALESRVNYGLNPAFDPRGIVGDDYADVNERDYGNADVMGPDAKHGSHVAGIIGGVRGTANGVDGIATNVRLMAIRTVPDGDERDKDVANAIRYAVDNGAHIINMSFGKGFSPEKAAVDAAVRYADAKGVLLVHAAGNDGADLAVSPSFPTPAYLDGGRPTNWIEVGASSWKGLDSLAASFSNYGRAQVDVFAPGVDIWSTVPDGGFEAQDGTSMAAPVVSGLAAMLMSYFPDLSATEVKQIILESATRHPDQQVARPGEGGDSVRFGELSVTGGVVNAYEAVKLARQRSRR